MHRFRQSGQAGAEPRARDLGDRRSQPPGDGVDVSDRDDPAEEPIATLCEACHETTAEVGPCCLVRIDHGQELEIAAAERHDPVVGPESLVASTGAGHKPKFAVDPGGRFIEVGGRVDT